MGDAVQQHPDIVDRIVAVAEQAIRRGGGQRIEAGDGIVYRVAAEL